MSFRWGVYIKHLLWIVPSTLDPLYYFADLKSILQVYRNEDSSNPQDLAVSPNWKRILILIGLLHQKADQVDVRARWIKIPLPRPIPSSSVLAGAALVMGRWGRTRPGRKRMAELGRAHESTEHGEHGGLHGAIFGQKAWVGPF